VSCTATPDASTRIVTEPPAGVARSAFSSRAVSMMIGVRSRARTRRQTSNPSMPGSPMSSTTRRIG